MGDARLRDIGERRLIADIVAKYCQGIGDDCAVVPVSESELIITTDPVPEPAAAVLANELDPYWKGWLLAVINASDLAAAGARPIAFTAAIEAPPESSVDEFERMLQGIADSCRNEEMPYVGGNLREGGRLTAVGNAVGVCQRGDALRRVKSQPGDTLVVIGQCGRFWQDVLAVRSGLPVDDRMRNESPLFRPKSQWRAMNALAKERLVQASIDNSDGLLPSLQQLAQSNQCEIELDVAALARAIPGERAGDMSDELRIRACFGWGDWNVIAAIAPENVERATRIAQRHGVSMSRVGEFKDRTPGVVLRRDGRIQIAPRLESERFATDSWFTKGIESYVEALANLSLP